MPLYYSNRLFPIFGSALNCQLKKVLFLSAAAIESISMSEVVGVFFSELALWILCLPPSAVSVGVNLPLSQWDTTTWTAGSETQAGLPGRQTKSGSTRNEPK